MKLLRKHVFHLSDIPRDLDAVITIDSRKEVDPRELGLLQSDVDRIWDSIIRMYKTGVHPAITVCIRHQGKVLLSRAIGHVRGNGPNDGPESEKVLATPDTPMCLYSTSKGITALLMHMLQEEGLINISDPVAFYAPEFARKGKDNITIHQILAHRGGIPGLPKDVALEVLWDEDQTWDLLCDAEPIVTDGSKLAYHAITGGFVLERVIRKVTGGDINAYIARKIREPMGMKYFSYGIEDEYRDDLAQTYATGPRPGPLMSAFIKRALGTDIASLEEIANDPRFQQAIIPAGNLAGTAEEACRFFQMMLNGGKWPPAHLLRAYRGARGTGIRQPHPGQDPLHSHALQRRPHAGGRTLRRVGAQQPPGFRSRGPGQQIRLGRSPAGYVGGGADLRHTHNRPSPTRPAERVAQYRQYHSGQGG